MIEFDEGVFKSREGLGHLVFQRSILRVAEDQSASLHVSVLSQVQVFVRDNDVLHACVRLINVLLVCEHNCKVKFQLLQKRLGLLVEESELCDSGSKLVLLGVAEASIVNVSGLLDSLIDLCRT